MTTGAYRNRLGESRITTALLTRGTDSASRRAGAQWSLGSKAKYAIAAGRAQTARTDKPVALYYGHPSFWGYYVRFAGLGEPRITNSLFMRASTNAARKAATRWAFGKLRALSVGANAVSYALSLQGAGEVAGHRLVAGTLGYALTLQPVTLTYVPVVVAATTTIGSQASKRTPQRGRTVRHGVTHSIYTAPHQHEPLLPSSIGFGLSILPVRFSTGVTAHEKRRRQTLRVLLITS